MNFTLVKKAYAASPIPLNRKFTLGIGGDPVESRYDTPADIVNIIVPNLMVAAGIIFFFMFILAAFKFMGDSAKGKEEALNIFKTALIGFILMFAAYWIMQIIKVITGADITF